MSKIAFLGLGNMGLGMATNLVRNGHTVIGFDPSPAAAEKATSHGIDSAASPVDAAEHADVIITMLPSGKHVLDVYADLVPAAAPGTLFLDCSTIDVADARAAAELAVGAGHRAVDAPVSGGTVAADGGTLTFMVGGPADAVDQAGSLLDADGVPHRPMRRLRSRSGREDLQQHDPGDLHDRRQRSFRAGRASWA